MCVSASVLRKPLLYLPVYHILPAESQCIFGGGEEERSHDNYFAPTDNTQDSNILQLLHRSAALLVFSPPIFPLHVHWLSRQSAFGSPLGLDQRRETEKKIFLNIQWGSGFYLVHNFHLLLVFCTLLCVWYPALFFRAHLGLQIKERSYPVLNQSSPKRNTFEFNYGKYFLMH